MVSQPGKEITAVHILHNISRNKGNKPMKFGQLIEYNMRNIFIENSHKNLVEKVLSDPFLKKF